MASTPQPQPGGADQGSPSPSASQAPADQTQMRLAQLFQACKGMAQADPTISAQMEKAAQAVNEAQSAYLMKPKPASPEQNPPY